MSVRDTIAVLEGLLERVQRRAQSAEARRPEAPPVVAAPASPAPALDEQLSAVRPLADEQPSTVRPLADDEPATVRPTDDLVVSDVAPASVARNIAEPVTAASVAEALEPEAESVAEAIEPEAESVAEAIERELAEPAIDELELEVAAPASIDLGDLAELGELEEIGPASELDDIVGAVVVPAPVEELSPVSELDAADLVAAEPEADKELALEPAADQELVLEPDEEEAAPTSSRRMRVEPAAEAEAEARATDERHDALTAAAPEHTPPPESGRQEVTAAVSPSEPFELHDGHAFPERASVHPPEPTPEQIGGTVDLPAAHHASDALELESADEGQVRRAAEPSLSDIDAASLAYYEPEPPIEHVPTARLPDVHPATITTIVPAPPPPPPVTFVVPEAPPAVEPAPSPLPAPLAFTIEAQVVHRPVPPASDVAVLVGAVRTFAPTTFGELLDASLALGAPTARST